MGEGLPRALDAGEAVPDMSASDDDAGSELVEVGSEELAALARPWADFLDSDDEPELVEVSDAELAALGLPADLGV
jgi:hypothetical protein